MDQLVVSWLLAAGLGLAIAVALGSFLNKGCGAFLFVLATIGAAGVSFLGAILGGWLGLFAAILVLMVAYAFVGRKLGGDRAQMLLILFWSGFSLSAVVGYWIGGNLGLVVISLIVQFVFWGPLYVFSGYVLPLHDSGQRGRAFRSLLTFSLGTNFPYYVQKGRELDPRVAGNPYKSFFAGPGIVLTGADHVVVVTDGVYVRVAEKPGLVFTDRFEVIQAFVDLRPQLRTFTVDVQTRDGIPIRVLIFFPFRVGAGGKQPLLGSSFPVNKDSIFRAVTAEVVEQDGDRQHSWDDLVEIHATRIMRDVISRYSFDELCLAVGAVVDNRAPRDDIVALHEVDEHAFEGSDTDDPRLKIRDEVVSRLRDEMRELGIDVLGGGISNLMPQDKDLIQQRIRSWSAKWKHRITIAEADREKRRVRLLEESQAGVEIELLKIMSDLLSESIARGQDMSDELLAAVFVAALDRMSCNPDVRDLLPRDTFAKLSFLRAHGRAS